jgi:hypothetical protein
MNRGARMASEGNTTTARGKPRYVAKVEQHPADSSERRIDVGIPRPNV